MKRLNMLLLPMLSMALSACGTIRAIAIQTAFPAAAAVETRVGANYIRAIEAGAQQSAVPHFDLMQARDVFDATVAPLISGVQINSLDRIRARTSSVCPPIPVQPPLPPQEPPAPGG